MITASLVSYFSLPCYLLRNTPQSPAEVRRVDDKPGYERESLITDETCRHIGSAFVALFTSPLLTHGSRYRRLSLPL